MICQFWGVLCFIDFTEFISKIIFSIEGELAPVSQASQVTYRDHWFSFDQALIKQQIFKHLEYYLVT